MTSGVIGLDVGGVNVKAAWRELGPQAPQVRVASRPFEVWRDPAGLAGVLEEVAADVGAVEVAGCGLTMTAELSDAFASKREGVRFVLEAAENALAGRPLLVLTTGGDLVTPDAARERPLDVAAANWMASALGVAETVGDALVVDVGSTTTDVVPVAGGRVTAAARNDLDRLLAGELVYTGALRTNLAAVCRRVPIRGRWCPVSSEQFAITADVHLILGHLAPAAYSCPTPDGRPATVELARARVARLVCADLEQLEEGEVDAIAAFLHAEQVRQLQAAVGRVSVRSGPSAPIVPLGSGAFLAREVAARLGRTVAQPPSAWGSAGAEVAPATALAGLLVGRLGARC
jgi:probable H4MPT-linked C1 transfer pathway protein